MFLAKKKNILFAPIRLMRRYHEQPISIIEEMNHNEELESVVSAFIQYPEKKDDILTIISKQETIHLFSCYNLVVLVRKLARWNYRMALLLTILIHLYFARKLLFPKSKLTYVEVEKMMKFQTQKYYFRSLLSISLTILAFRLNKYSLRSCVRTIHYKPKTDIYEISYFGKNLKDVRSVELTSDGIKYELKNPTDYLSMEFTDAENKKRKVRLIGMFLGKNLMKILHEKDSVNRLKELTSAAKI